MLLKSLRTLFAGIFLIVFLNACDKNGVDPINPQAKNPVSVTKSYYQGSNLLETTQYDIEPTGSGDTVSLKITDSIASFPYVKKIQRKQFIFNPATKLISKITAEALNNGPGLTNYEYKMNFDLPRNGTQFGKMLMTYFSNNNPITSFDFIGGNNSATGDLYLNILYSSNNNQRGQLHSSADGRIFRIDETLISDPILYLYFTNSIPGYQYKKETIHTYLFDQDKRCKSVTIENGHYEYIPNGPFQWDPVFIPSAVRKLDFRYSTDYSNLEKALNKLFLLKESGIIRAAETYTLQLDEIDVYTFNQTVSETYTDSCFTVTNNTKTLTRASTYTNNIKKDNSGNIESITQVNTKDNYRLVYSFKYN